MNVYIACFDVQDDRARRRIGRLLGLYGDRVQESVFEIMVKTPEEFDRLRGKLLTLLSQGDDLRFYHLCRHCRHGSMTVEGHPVAHYPAGVVL